MGRQDNQQKMAWNAKRREEEDIKYINYNFHIEVYVFSPCSPSMTQRSQWKYPLQMEITLRMMISARNKMEHV